MILSFLLLSFFFPLHLFFFLFFPCFCFFHSSSLPCLVLGASIHSQLQQHHVIVIYTSSPPCSQQRPDPRPARRSWHCPSSHPKQHVRNQSSLLLFIYTVFTSQTANIIPSQQPPPPPLHHNRQTIPHRHLRHPPHANHPPLRNRIRHDRVRLQIRHRLRPAQGPRNGRGRNHGPGPRRAAL